MPAAEATAAPTEEGAGGPAPAADKEGAAAAQALEGAAVASAEAAPPAPRQRGADEVYDPAEFALPLDPETDLPLGSVPTTRILSLDSHKRNNVAYIEDDVLVTASGNNVLFLNLSDMSHRYMPGLDGGGIGALAVHPSRKFLAVAEKCRHRSPNVYIYSYPQLALVRVLRLGTDRAYSALSFNEQGDMLASVGGFPDYLLTLWNWEQESITLRSKAFSQDVYTVKFSPYFEGILNTSGTGHIRFWKMASTFTGLKLQVGCLAMHTAVDLACRGQERSKHGEGGL